MRLTKWYERCEVSGVGNTEVDTIQKLISNYQKGMYQLHECLSDILFCLGNVDLKIAFESLPSFWRDSLVKFIDDAPVSLEAWLNRRKFSMEAWVGPTEIVDSKIREKQEQVFQGIERLRRHLKEGQSDFK